MSVQLDVPGTLVDVYVCGDWGWEREVMYLHHSCSSSSFILRISKWELHLLMDLIIVYTQSTYIVHAYIYIYYPCQEGYIIYIRPLVPFGEGQCLDVAKEVSRVSPKLYESTGLPKGHIKGRVYPSLLAGMFLIYTRFRLFKPETFKSSLLSISIHSAITLLAP